MQTHPGRFIQFFLISLGLGMLIFAVVLNHYHPRNAGVATAGHNFITVLALDIRQPVSRGGSTMVANNEATGLAIQPAKPVILTAAIQTSKDKLAVTEAVANLTMTFQDRCAKLDNELFTQVKNTVDESYQTYLSNKQMGQSTGSYYQTYLKASDTAYSAYKLQLTNQGCQSLQPMPVVQPR